MAKIVHFRLKVQVSEDADIDACERQVTEALRNPDSGLTAEEWELSMIGVADGVRPLGVAPGDAGNPSGCIAGL